MGGNDEDDLERLKARVVVMAGPPFGSSSPLLKVETGNVHASLDNVSMPMNPCVGVESYLQDGNGLWRLESEEIE